MKQKAKKKNDTLFVKKKSTHCEAGVQREKTERPMRIYGKALEILREGLCAKIQRPLRLGTTKAGLFKGSEGVKIFCTRQEDRQPLPYPKREKNKTLNCVKYFFI